MNEENIELNKEMEGLKKNLKVLQINTDTLVYEDETRSKELEVRDIPYGIPKNIESSAIMQF